MGRRKGAQAQILLDQASNYLECLGLIRLMHKLNYSS
jgi:hypothetical protein